MIRETNRITRRAARYHVRGDHARAEELYDEADARRADIESRGVELKERDCRSWRRLQTQTQSGTTRKLQRKT
ncbi:Tcc1l8.4 [Trypanosoma grayi]|uniref:Tcc1l8.4 n=1 Tax=Trypanosoma grayi TaxID=71804 RepID=UPI0004F44FB8|nr:Tcc1l8.4 [Trypanosoma grayi]KEG05677.1 Tcc1l8.4 [Trypanosoma grayi]